MIADITLLGPDGKVVAQVDGLVLVETTRADLKRQLQQDLSHWFYQIQWEEKPRVGTPAGRPFRAKRPCGWCWPGRAASGRIWPNSLRDQGHRCDTRVAGRAIRADRHEDHYQIDPASRDDYLRLFSEVFGSGEAPCRGIVHLWGLDSRCSPDAGVEQLHEDQAVWWAASFISCRPRARPSCRGRPACGW